MLMGGDVGVEEIYKASATGGRASLLPVAEGLWCRWQGCSGTGGRGGVLPKVEKNKINDFYSRK